MLPQKIGMRGLCAAWDDMYTICEMAIEENDDSMLEELESEYKQFSEKVEETRLGTLLTGEYDANNKVKTQRKIWLGTKNRSKDSA